MHNQKDDHRIDQAFEETESRLKDYNNGRSEVIDLLARGPATHMHHIFPRSQYPGIAAYMENIIALTSGQHLQEAHPNGNTQVINREFQYMCLICKAGNIQKNLTGGFGEDIVYSFADFMYVLDVGLSTDYFESLAENDFNSVMSGIDFNYQL